MSAAEYVRSRVEGMVCERLGEDVVVYDAREDRAHVLNAQAAAVYEAAREGTTIDRLTSELGADGGEAIIRLALDELSRAGLLEDAPITPIGMSRRTLLRNIGIAAVAAPLVTTILTQAPAAAVANALCTASISCGSGEVCVIPAGSTSGRCARTCQTNATCENVVGCTCSGTSTKYCTTTLNSAVYC